MKIPNPKLKAFWLARRLPTTTKQIAEWEKVNPPETWGPLPKSLEDPMKILQRGEVPIRLSPERIKNIRKEISI